MKPEVADLMLESLKLELELELELEREPESIDPEVARYHGDPNIGLIGCLKLSLIISMKNGFRMKSDDPTFTLPSIIQIHTRMTRVLSVRLKALLELWQMFRIKFVPRVDGMVRLTCAPLVHLLVPGPLDIGYTTP